LTEGYYDGYEYLTSCPSGSSASGTGCEYVEEDHQLERCGRDERWRPVECRLRQFASPGRRDLYGGRRNSHRLQWWCDPDDRNGGRDLQKPFECRRHRRDGGRRHRRDARRWDGGGRSCPVCDCDAERRDAGPSFHHHPLRGRLGELTIEHSRKLKKERSL